MIDFPDPDMGIWKHDPRFFLFKHDGAGAHTYDFFKIPHHQDYSAFYFGILSTITNANVWTLSVLGHGTEIIRYGTTTMVANTLYPIREDFWLGKGDYLRLYFSGSAGSEVIRIFIDGFSRNCKCKVPTR